MKLRNKRTGKIIEWFNNTDSILPETLKKLNEEWEDYEEPKEHWAIDQFGEPINVSGLSRLQLEKLHRLGNDFPSENATIKAIEKLKAWRRLKDKGFKFDGYGRYHWTGEEWPHVAFSYPNFDDLFDDSETVANLDLLFSQEDD